ncbi:hypothetical protein FB451DRAFT_1196860 [Mycena latifolia]|nr:hypothetical protein FB451DRAFT_1196860 [Mycena latifolia]
MAYVPRTASTASSAQLALCDFNSAAYTNRHYTTIVLAASCLSEQPAGHFICSINTTTGALSISWNNFVDTVITCILQILSPPAEVAQWELLCLPWMDSFKAVSTAFKALNSKLGIAEEVWAALPLAVQTCSTCTLVHTIHAHEGHLLDRKCNNVGTARPSVIITGPSHGKARAVDSSYHSGIIVVDSEDEDDIPTCCPIRQLKNNMFLFAIPVHPRHPRSSH